MSIISELKNKRILIWGYGREGKATEHFLKTYCEPALVEVYEGKREGIEEDKYDWIVKSPGIVMEEEHPKYTSQTELFMREFRDRTIGITGTKGKSTTTAMLYTVLKECSGKNVVLVGNIGRPCLDYFEEITEDTIVVFELSCHQLAHAKTSPHVAVFLNLFEEHLDYYKTFEKYFYAKSNITRNQRAEDIFLVGENVPMIPTKAQTVVMKETDAVDFQLQVPGAHNRHNGAFVMKIAKEVFGCNAEEIKKSMMHFEGLPHRLQKVGCVGDITFYDDSISTIPEATIQAVQSIKDVQTVLVGGMDRGINYDILIDFIKVNPKIQFILAYESGQRIYQSVSACVNVYPVEDLKEAVTLAKKITQKGRACVLSPAAASYGYFKDFEERGNVFAQFVRES